MTIDQLIPEIERIIALNNKDFTRSIKANGRDGYMTGFFSGKDIGLTVALRLISQVEEQDSPKVPEVLRKGANMDAMQATAAAPAGQEADSQVTYTLDPHVTIAIACLVIALLVAFFVLVVSTIGKNNDGPKA